jgi:hypothetical protein
MRDYIIYYLLKSIQRKYPHILQNNKGKFINQVKVKSIHLFHSLESMEQTNLLAWNSHGAKGTRMLPKICKSFIPTAFN